MSDLLRKLSPTRSPAFAIIIFLANVPFWLAFSYVWIRILHGDDRLAKDVMMIGTAMTILVAGVLYGLAPGFRSATTRVSLWLPRPVLVAFWIAVWLGTADAYARAHGWWQWLDERILDWGAAAASLATVALFLSLHKKLPGEGERRVRAAAPPLYRALAWAGGCLSVCALYGGDRGWWGLRVWEGIYLLTAALFFLGYGLDARWASRHSDSLPQ